MSTPTLSTRRPNLTEVQFGSVTYWFSYSTCIAFSSPATGFCVSENAWSPTTGKHLNEIDGGTKEAKARRIPHAIFTQRLADLTA